MRKTSRIIIVKEYPLNRYLIVFQTWKVFDCDISLFMKQFIEKPQFKIQNEYLWKKILWISCIFAKTELNQSSLLMGNPVYVLCTPLMGNPVYVLCTPLMGNPVYVLCTPFNAKTLKTDLFMERALVMAIKFYAHVDLILINVMILIWYNYKIINSIQHFHGVFLNCLKLQLN